MQHYDYGSIGAYFVTVCAEGRACLFGEVVADAVRLTDAGRMVDAVWRENSSYWPAYETDAFVVMPNHVHGVLFRLDLGCALALPDVMHRFKSLTTRRYIEGVRRCGWPPFRGRLWQRGYHDHVVRDPDDLDRIRKYIEDNPAQWAIDAENPERPRPR